MENNDFRGYGLSNEILAAIDKLGYKNPSEVQKEVLKVVSEKSDIIVKSQTGSGKTAAFAIPICDAIEWEENSPQALVLTPTRELCVQVKEDISNIGRFKRIRCAAVFGKQPFQMQATELKQKVHVVVGTPGRTIDHLERGTLCLDKIKYLIIDEADEMLNMGFIEQVEAIINKLPKDRITMLFSATIPPIIERLCQNYMRDAQKIEIEAKNIIADRIEHLKYQVQEDFKGKLLKNIMITENPESAIIFCRTKENVDSLYEKLKRINYPCDKIHGGMMQNDRLEAMQKFKRGEFAYLIATDVAARGIDVENVSLIINFDLPLEQEAYVHRIGRTGRAGKNGKAITFVTPYEGRFLKQIEDYIKIEIPEAQEITKEMVEAARDSFEERLKNRPKLKKAKSSELNKDITKLYLNGGKKKKIRVLDIVGTISNIKGITAEDIGIIDVQDTVSYVDILNGKGKLVLEALKTMTIKGKSLKVQIARK